jgi:hypothetical protein
VFVGDFAPGSVGEDQGMFVIAFPLNGFHVGNFYRPMNRVM